MLTGARSEVKFAHHFAVRRNFTHEVNFTIRDNFTCPKGKLSFSVFSVKENTLIGNAFFIGIGSNTGVSRKSAVNGKNNAGDEACCFI